MNDNTICRCGMKTTDSFHPCHGKGYTCTSPAKERFYEAGPAFVAGVMPKWSANQTWACDDCWKDFVKGLINKD